MPGEEIKEKDFIEVIYTGKVKGGEIFDSNREEDAKKLYKDIKVKPLVVCVGQKMILPFLDEDFKKRKINEHYVLEISSDNAFGKRKRELIKTIPIRIFFEKKINPQPGMMLNMDGMLVKIISVSGGRVIVDFNNPLAGKDIVYEMEITKKISEEKQKADSLFEFLLNSIPEYKIENNKIILAEKDKKLAPFLSMFKDKFKEILGLEFEETKAVNLGGVKIEELVKEEKKEEK